MRHSTIIFIVIVTIVSNILIIIVPVFIIAKMPKPYNDPDDITIDHSNNIDQQFMTNDNSYNMWPWRVKIPTRDLTDVTLVSEILMTMITTLMKKMKKTKMI